MHFVMSFFYLNKNERLHFVIVSREKCFNTCIVLEMNKYAILVEETRFCVKNHVAGIARGRNFIDYFTE